MVEQVRMHHQWDPRNGLISSLTLAGLHGFYTHSRGPLLGLLRSRKTTTEALYSQLPEV